MWMSLQENSKSVREIRISGDLRDTRDWNFENFRICHDHCILWDDELIVARGKANKIVACSLRRKVLRDWLDVVEALLTKWSIDCCEGKCYEIIYLLRRMREQMRGSDECYFCTWRWSIRWLNSSREEQNWRWKLLYFCILEENAALWIA